MWVWTHSPNRPLLLRKKSNVGSQFREEPVAICSLGVGDECITTLFVDRESWTQIFVTHVIIKEIKKIVGLSIIVAHVIKIW